MRMAKGLIGEFETRIHATLNKIGQLKKWLYRQLVLHNRRHNDCVFIPNSRISWGVLVAKWVSDKTGLEQRLVNFEITFSTLSLYLKRVGDVLQIIGTRVTSYV